MFLPDSNDVTRLADNARTLERLLNTSQTVSDEASSILGWLGAELQQHQENMHPIRASQESCSRAQRNMQKVLDILSRMTTHAAAPAQVEKELQGVRAQSAESAQQLMRLFRRLSESMSFLETYSHWTAAAQALKHGNRVRSSVVREAETSFLAVLDRNAKAVDVQKLTAVMEQLERGGGADAPNALEADGDRWWKHLLVDKACVVHLKLLGDLIAEAYASGGSSPAFSKYLVRRGSAVDQTLRVLDVKIPSRSALQSAPLDVVEAAGAGWCRLMRGATCLLQWERQYAQQVLPSQEAAAAFEQLLTEAVEPLTGQAGDVAAAKLAPDKLFVMMEMYTALVRCLPVLAGGEEGKKSGSVLQPLRSAAYSLLTAARQVFAQFASVLTSDSSKIEGLPPGTVHPLSAFTVRFLKRLARLPHRDALLLADTTRLGLPTRAGQGGHEVLDILQTLLDVLDAKAKALKDAALAYLFMCSNLHFLVNSADAAAELGQLVGEKWARKQHDAMWQQGKCYIEESWSFLFKSTHLGRQPEKVALKERIKAVSAGIAKLLDVQRAWSIPDATLRAAIRTATLKQVMPPYQAFWQVCLSSGKQLERHLQVPPTELERIITKELFSAGRPGKYAPLTRARCTGYNVRAL